ncbi:MAG: helix-turn-helix transcriptional regulator [Lachnospiraceae bacterium]|nr:helix-turn-helix transcriptional regulator [Lachnospiraceae bacterium]
MNHDGYFLKKRRQRLGLTLREVSEKSGINLKQYQRFEAGDRELDNASFTTVLKVLTALEIDVGKYAAGEYEIKELIYRGHDGRLYNFDTDEPVDA